MDLQGTIKWEEIFQKGILYCFKNVAAESVDVAQATFLSSAVSI